MPSLIRLIHVAHILVLKIAVDQSSFTTNNLHVINSNTYKYQLSKHFAQQGLLAKIDTLIVDVSMNMHIIRALKAPTTNGADRF